MPFSPDPLLTLYDAANRVTLANNASTGASVNFLYDGLNRCVQRKTGSVVKNITYDGWKPIAEWNGNGSTLVAWNLYGPGPDEILMRYSASGTPYLHYHSDQFGNVKFLLDTNNALVEKYTYDAFGAPTITNAGGTVLTDSAYKNRFMFTGREYLSTIGIYDYRNRMYSPLLGRFFQTDPMRFDAGDNNLYRYVDHNPMNSEDPTGLFDVDFGGGDFIGGFGHIGYNGGQWSYGGYVGVGGGFFININPYDTGSREPGLTSGRIMTWGEGLPDRLKWLGGDLTSYSGTDGSYVSIDTNVGPVSMGTQMDANGNITNNRGTITGGAGIVWGSGVINYANPVSGVLNSIGQGIQNFFDGVMSFFRNNPGTDGSISSGPGPTMGPPVEMPSRYQPRSPRAFVTSESYLCFHTLCTAIRSRSLRPRVQINSL